MLTIRVAMEMGGRAKAIFMNLGQMSMTIYVAHIIAMSGLRVLLTKLGFDGGEWAFLLLCVVAGLGLPIALHQVMQRIGALWLLGLGRRGAAGSRRQLASAHNDRLTHRVSTSK